MRRYFPDIDTFKAAAQGADVVPVYRQLLADRLTPVTAFEVLGRDANAFLLESVVGGEQVARYSFIATSPALVYQAYAGRAWITRGNQGFGAPAQEFVTTDPLADLQKLLPRRTYHRDPSLPVFTGGPEQLWRIDQLTDGTYRLMPKGVPGSIFAFRWKIIPGP